MSDHTTIETIHRELASKLVEPVEDDTSVKYLLGKDGFVISVITDKTWPEELIYGEWRENISETGEQLNRYRYVSSRHLGYYIEFRVSDTVIAKCDVFSLHLLKTYRWQWNEKRRAILSYTDNDTVYFKRLVMNAGKKRMVTSLNKDGTDVRRVNLILKGGYAPSKATADIVPKIVATIAKIVKRGALIGGKPCGSVYRTDSRFRVEFANPTVNRSFAISKYSSTEAAREAAEACRYQISVERDDVKNRYRHVWADDGTEYLEVMLQDGTCFLCDVQDLELVNSTVWISNGGYVVTRTGVKFHRLVLPGCAQVDHINGNPMDERRANLRDGSDGVNETNKTLASNNKSGVTGVRFVPQRNAWAAQWTENEEKQRRSYAVSVYGEEKARELAIAAREDANLRLELNVSQRAQ